MVFAWRMLSSNVKIKVYTYEKSRLKKIKEKNQITLLKILQRYSIKKRKEQGNTNKLKKIEKRKISMSPPTPQI